MRPETRAALDRLAARGRWRRRLFWVVAGAGALALILVAGEPRTEGTPYEGRILSTRAYHTDDGVKRHWVVDIGEALPLQVPMRPDLVLEPGDALCLRTAERIVTGFRTHRAVAAGACP